MATMQDLRSEIRGSVITPEHVGYDSARTVFFGGIDRRPAMVVQVANAEDVSRVINFAREGGMALAVRSGGHSTAGHGVVDDGIVLDLRAMRAIEVDAKQRTAWAETGMTAREYSVATHSHGFTTGFGDTGSVGIGGLTLGGGLGFLLRKYGLTIDDLLAADVMTANGELLRVDAQNHPDLFWAIRGGGGNFGVATRFQFRLHPVDRIVGGMLVLPATPESVGGFISEAQLAPDELTTIANIMTAPPAPFIPPEHRGKLVLIGRMAYTGPVPDAQKVLAPFRSLGTPIADMVRLIPYPEIYEPDDPNFHPVMAGRTMFIDTIDRKKLDVIFDYLSASTAPMRVTQIRVLGGAMARVPADATAFAHRSRKFMVATSAIYGNPQEKAQHEDWVTRFAAALGREKSGAYVGFLGDEGEARIRDAYPGPTWDRLQRIKARYDPTNVFRVNQNIPAGVPARTDLRRGGGHHGRNH
jgi:FAD/FMN-containing dehydrogenase